MRRFSKFFHFIYFFNVKESKFVIEKRFKMCVIQCTGNSCTVGASFFDISSMFTKYHVVLAYAEESPQSRWVICAHDDQVARTISSQSRGVLYYLHSINIVWCICAVVYQLELNVCDWGDFIGGRRCWRRMNAILSFYEWTNGPLLCIIVSTHFLFI